MAFRRKRKDNKSWRDLLQSIIPQKNKRPQQSWVGPSLIRILMILLIVCVFGGIIAGLFFLDKYVQTTASAERKKISLEILNVPGWVPDEVKDDILTIAEGTGERIELDENIALITQRNIEENVAWITEVKVRTMHNGLQIEGKWRRPIARLRRGTQEYYVDIDKVVLDYVPMPHLWVAEVKGLSSLMYTPPIGEILQLDDLEAAITILDRLERMDKKFTPDNPLLYEIASIDVSNFGGRKNSRNPHIVLNAKDDTEIIWGAEFGTWQQHLESSDEQKLAKLYGYYKGSGTLLGGAKYVNLRDPKYKVPQPIDNY